MATVATSTPRAEATVGRSCRSIYWPVAQTKDSDDGDGDADVAAARRTDSLHEDATVVAWAAHGQHTGHLTTVRDLDRTSHSISTPIPSILQED